MATNIFGAGARFTFALAGLLTFTISLATPARAGTIGIAADMEHRFKGVGSLAGVIEYNAAADASVGTLQITLTNTMTASSRAYITGFAFNIDSDDPSAQAWLMGGPAIYQGIHDARVPHFGLFESGAGLRGSVVGGGNPRNGIGAGETQVFTFEIKASDASRLTPESFLNGPLAHNFIVRFRGLGPDGMDLVPLQAAPVPGPSALTFLAVVTVLSRWRRRLAV